MPALGDVMNHPSRLARYFLISAAMSLLAVAVGLTPSWTATNVSAQNPSSASPTADPDRLLDGFRHVEVASLSDAAEQILGRKTYMSHRMQSIFPVKFAGYAVTVLLKRDEGNKDPNALAGMIAAIDAGAKDSVYVMTVEDGADIAGMGGLMGTTMYSRGYAGAVIEGGGGDGAGAGRNWSPVYGAAACL